MRFSNHALERAAQRGIAIGSFDRVARIGEARRRAGATEFIITARAADQAIAELKREIHEIERLKNKSFIVDGESVITTFHSHEKWRRR